MLQTTRRLAVILVGLHLLLGWTLLVTDAVHGIDDQDASFVLLVLVHYLCVPSCWLIKQFQPYPRDALVILVGIFQWALIAFALAAAYHGARAVVRRYA